jgi:hypothetical protein
MKKRVTSLLSWMGLTFASAFVVMISMGVHEMPLALTQ